MQTSRLPALTVIMVATSAFAGVERVEILDRHAVAGGASFGDAGVYEKVTGVVHFAFDPENEWNRAVVDLDLAPRNADGLVEARANLLVLQPADPERRRGVAFVEVSNRGGKATPRYFMNGRGGALEELGDFGDGLLMREGLTLVWIGWQFDVPEQPGALRLVAPVARHADGSAITGLVRSDWTVDRPETSLFLGHRNHRPYPLHDADAPENVLSVRDGRDATRIVIPRERWRFEEDRPGWITLEGGFEAGRIYECVYVARDPVVVGLGLAAIRDIAAYAKRDADCVFGVHHAIAFGVSQTGRFLRHFLYQGFNTDEAGRAVYDGLLIHTAGAGRGSFNHRFAQPSRDAHRYSAFFYPTDIAPFAGTDGLLAELDGRGHVPRVMYTNTGYEYWGRAASLIHTTREGDRDIDLHENERIYHLASGQHFVGPFPQPRNRIGTARAWRGNPLDFLVTLRALAVALVEWVDGDRPPPPSRYPRVDDETLVTIDAVRFPEIVGIAFPTVIHTAYHADYGPRWDRGIVDHQPPRLGATYPVLVAQVDGFGNERGGVPTVEIVEPLGTYAPWNLRHDAPAAPDELTDFYGTFIPFTADAVDARYASREAYRVATHAAAETLVGDRLLLAEDVDRVVGRALRTWDWIHEGE